MTGNKKGTQKKVFPAVGAKKKQTPPKFVKMKTFTMHKSVHRMQQVLAFRAQQEAHELDIIRELSVHTGGVDPPVPTPAAITFDPNEAVGSGAGEIRRDEVHLGLTAKEFVDAQNYTSRNGTGTRFAWLAPLSTMNKAGTIPVVDSRGQLNGLLKVEFEFHNVLFDTINVKASSPRSAVLKPEIIASRAACVRRDIPKGSKYKYTVDFKETSNLFSPFVNLVGGVRPVIILADMLLQKPAESVATGRPIPLDEEAVRLSIIVTYTVATAVTVTKGDFNSLRLDQAFCSGPIGFDEVDAVDPFFVPINGNYVSVPGIVDIGMQGIRLAPYKVYGETVYAIETEIDLLCYAGRAILLCDDGHKIHFVFERSIAMWVACTSKGPIRTWKDEVISFGRPLTAINDPKKLLLTFDQFFHYVTTVVEAVALVAKLF